MDLGKLINAAKGDRIKVIKALSKEENIGLKEAKELVDKAYEEKYKAPNITSEQEQASSSDSKNKMKKLLIIGHIEDIWNSNGTKILKYQVEMKHTGLNEHKVLTAPDEDILMNKVDTQKQKWEEKWDLLVEKKRIEDLKASKTAEAIKMTEEAEFRTSEIQDILVSGIKNAKVMNWDDLKNLSEYSKELPEKPTEPVFYLVPPKPDKSSIEFQPKYSLLSGLIGSLKSKAIAESEYKYNIAVKVWEENKAAIENENVELEQIYQDYLTEYKHKMKLWDEDKKKYDNDRKKLNESIDLWKIRFEEKEPTSIVEYFETVLNKADLPSFITKEFEIEYNPINNILIIDYKLPSVGDFPNLKEVKYISTKDEMKEYYHSDSFMEKLYDSSLYSIILRNIYEIFISDYINAIETVSFNGWINNLNKSTGYYEDICIASVQAKKNEFLNIELSKVDPKACFKSLKGISASKLIGITPVQPILSMNKNDKRFVSSYDVTTGLDDTTNLAAIPWEDFEHLIRELFEKEFSSSGGEVKVTQASRDGGVDAIAFDPDPIRGGKIVIQAKRYTNVVGVAAVRDLYGTVINEGASRGVLVTTSEYGSDSYEFAKNKPITLLNGGNLLSLLEKHGHRAKIDLKEAKLLNKQEFYY